MDRNVFLDDMLDMYMIPINALILENLLMLIVEDYDFAVSKENSDFESPEIILIAFEVEDVLDFEGFSSTKMGGKKSITLNQKPSNAVIVRHEQSYAIKLSYDNNRDVWFTELPQKLLDVAKEFKHIWICEIIDDERIEDTKVELHIDIVDME